MWGMSVPELIGQALGVVAVILGFINYQMKSQKGILVILFATAIVFCGHYLLLGLYPAFALNFVAIFRCIVYYNRDKKIFSGWYIPLILAGIMAVMGAISWQGPMSLLVIFGIIINTIAISSPNAQLVRASILISSPMVLIYNIWGHSVGGSIYESIVIISSIIGLIKYRKTTEN